MRYIFSLDGFRRMVDLVARLYVSIILINYGLGKIVGGQFYRQGAIPQDIAELPSAELAGFDLAWLFFGYSEGYIWFIGLSQIIGSILLLFNRTKLLGVIILLPVLLNIMVVDFCFEVSSGALFSAMLYTALLLLIVVLNWKRVWPIWQSLTKVGVISEPKPYIRERLFQLLFVLLGVAGLFFIENEVLNFLGR